MNEYVSYASPVSTVLPDVDQTRAEICTRFHNYTVSKLLHKHLVVCLFVFLALQPSVAVFSQPGSGLLASSFSRFLDHTQRRATAGRTPLDE
jgi:hypothetical protein